MKKPACGYCLDREKVCQFLKPSKCHRVRVAKEMEKARQRRSKA